MNEDDQAGSDAPADAKTYWCIYCERRIVGQPQPEGGSLFVHDEVPHPEDFDYADESRPQ